jgi:hypothetical protein
MVLAQVQQTKQKFHQPAIFLVHFFIVEKMNTPKSLNSANKLSFWQPLKPSWHYLTIPLLNSNLMNRQEQKNMLRDHETGGNLR